MIRRHEGISLRARPSRLVIGTAPNPGLHMSNLFGIGIGPGPTLGTPNHVITSDLDEYLMYGFPLLNCIYLATLTFC